MWKQVPAKKTNTKFPSATDKYTTRKNICVPLLLNRGCREVKYKLSAVNTIHSDTNITPVLDNINGPRPYARNTNTINNTKIDEVLNDPAMAGWLLPYAGMSQDAYSPTPSNISGWEPVKDDWQTIFRKAGRSDEIDPAISSGFSAVVYQDRTGDITISYRGTINGPDLSTDIAAANGETPAQFTYAKDLATLVENKYLDKNKYPNAVMSVTGHSLGGALATYAGQQVPGVAQVITFNATRPGLLSSATRPGTTQTNVFVRGDPFTDPKAPIGSYTGLGQLPGQTFTVKSTPFETNIFAQTQPPDTRLPCGIQGTHCLDGIIGGLCVVNPSSSSCSSRLPAPGVQQPGATPFKPTPNLPAAVSPPPSQTPTTMGAAPPPPPIPGAPFSWKAPSTTFTPSGSLSAIPPSSHPAPGGISLSKAAAARMPLNIDFDGAYYKDGEVVLSGRYDQEHRMDAALLLTAIRLACESDDPYFSLDPLNGAAWLNEGQSASNVLWERIKDDFKSHPTANTHKKPVLEFRTVSARRDYPALWASLAPSYPNLKSKLVFKPEWLRETRFGEVLYRGDLLLKELAYGVPILQEGELRADKIERYVTAGNRDAAKRLLAV